MEKPSSAAHGSSHDLHRNYGCCHCDPGFQDPNAAAAISSILDATRKDRGAEVWLGIGCGGWKSKVVV